MGFHLFSALRARKALQDSAVSARDEFRYWFAYSLIGTAYSYQAGYFGLQIGWFLIYDVAAVIIIMWIGLHETFKANGADQGINLLQRLSVLGVPLSITALIANQVLWLASWHLFPLMIDQSSFRNPALAWHMVTFVCASGISVWFWWRMHHHISKLNGTQYE
jgi:hypothetical protein